MPTREDTAKQIIPGMDGIDYETTGPMWDQPCRVGRFVGTREYAFGSWSAIDTVVAWEISKPWACRHPREVASRCGVLIQGRTYRWLFHKTTGDLVGWREEPLPAKVEPAPKPKATEPVGVPHEGFSGAGVFLRWEEARLVFRNEMGWEDYWCSHGPDRDSAIARCGDLVSGKRYRWLWDSPNGGLLLGWREEPLPKTDTVSKHKCEMCGAETENSYQDMAKVCNGCAVEFHNTVWACLHVAKAMYGDKARVKLYRGDPGNTWKINVVNESRANTGIMGKNDGKSVMDAFEALCQEAVSPCFPHPDDGPLEARLDAIGEAAMRLGAGVYGAADR